MPGANPSPFALVLDTSVAVRWYVPEPGSSAALALLAEPHAWLAPRLLLTEFGAALFRKVGRGELTPAEATDAVESLLRYAKRGTIRLAPDEALITQAFRLALLLHHKLPDCLYLALAEEEGAGLATADDRLGRLAASRGIPVRLLPSAD